MEINREINVNVVTPKDPVEGTVVENRLLTEKSSPHFTRHVVIDVSGTPLENDFQTGQAFGVIPEWDHKVDYNKLHLKSKDHKLRLYSIASPSWGDDGDGKHLSTTVKRVFDENWEDGTTFLGVCSNYLCDLQEGDTVKVTGPTGRHFLLPDREVRDEHNYVFLAAGTGIAPFRGMVMELLEQEVENEIWLILGVPYSTDVLYGSFFEQLADEHENFHFDTAISREEKTEDGRKMYVQEKLLDMPDTFGPLFQDDSTLAYICGLKGMETGIYRAMTLLGGRHLLEPHPGAGHVNPEELDPRDEFFQQIRPNKERLRVEVY